MKKILSTIIILFIAVSSFSQSKNIVGSWIWRDSTNSIQFFIKANGNIEKRSALITENIWTQIPKIGTYIFTDDKKLVVSWSDKSLENIEVKFIANNAEFRFTNSKMKNLKPYLFLRIVDEEIIIDK